MGQLMTLDEKLTVSNNACALLDAGDREGYTRLTRSIPMPPYLAKIMKEKLGANHLIKGGWNLTEAEEAFGIDWLDR